MKKCILCFILIFNTSLSAEEDIIDVAYKFNSQKKQILSNEKKKRKALGELYRINRRNKRLSRKMGALRDKKMEFQSQVDSIAQSVVAIEKEIKILKKRVGRRFRELYKLNGLGIFYALFKSKSMYELDRSLYLLKRVTDYDKKSGQSLVLSLENLKDEKKKLIVTLRELEISKKKLTAEEDLSKKHFSERERILGRINKTMSAERKSLEMLRLRGLKLSEASEGMDLLFKEPFFQQKGKLHHPVKAKISQGFALMENLYKGIKIQHKGWFYSGKGKTVSAIYDGQVAFVGSLDGYGSLILINHGDDYYSIYGHLSEVKVEYGDYVRGGAELAQTGTSSRWLGPGSYFEIRHFSEAEDPARWITEKYMKISGIRQ